MKLEWMALPNKKASRVRLQRNIPIFDETKKIDQLSNIPNFYMMFLNHM